MKTVVGDKIPFHYGIFFHAVVGYLGREPDFKCDYGWDGYYYWWYEPQDEEEQKMFAKKAVDIAKWLDSFDITFSGSECWYGAHASHPDKGEILIIQILHPVEKRT